MTEQTDKPIAVQLYSLRNLEEPLSQTLHQVAGMGYRGVETIRDHGISAGEMNDLLDANNLTACSTHVPLSQLEDGLGSVIAFNQAICNDCLVLPAPAVRYDESGRSYVYVVGGDDAVQVVDVTTGLDDGIQIEILSGLTGSERVVGPTIDRLEPGQKVRVK